MRQPSAQMPDHELGNIDNAVNQSPGGKKLRRQKEKWNGDEDEGIDPGKHARRQQGRALPLSQKNDGRRHAQAVDQRYAQHHQRQHNHEQSQDCQHGG